MITLISQISDKNKYYLQNSPIASAPACVSSDGSATISSNLDEIQLELEFENLKISSNPVKQETDKIYLRTRTIPTPDSRSKLKGYTAEDLLSKFVLEGIELPLTGYIYNNPENIDKPEKKTAFVSEKKTAFVQQPERKLLLCCNFTHLTQILQNVIN